MTKNNKTRHMGNFWRVKRVLKISSFEINEIAESRRKEKARQLGEFTGMALDLSVGANIWSIMSITSRTTLDTPRPFARVHARARAEEHAKKVLLAEHVHRDWAVNTSNDEQRPESSMNRGINLSTKPNCCSKYSPSLMPSTLNRESVSRN